MSNFNKLMRRANIQVVHDYEREQCGVMVDSYLSEGLDRKEICRRLNYLGFSLQGGKPFTLPRLSSFLSYRKKKEKNANTRKN